MAKIYADAIQIVRSGQGGADAPLVVPDACAFSIDDLLADRLNIPAFVDRLRGAA